MVPVDDAVGNICDVLWHLLQNCRRKLFRCQDDGVEVTVVIPAEASLTALDVFLVTTGVPMVLLLAMLSLLVIGYVS